MCVCVCVCVCVRVFVHVCVSRQPYTSIAIAILESENFVLIYSCKKYNDRTEFKKYEKRGIIPSCVT